MNLVLFGPPGAGKGTQAKRICETFHLYHLSTGDAIRAAINNGSEFGRKIRETVQSGELIPDEMVTELVEAIVSEKQKETSSFLFDGFPRTVEQVDGLEGIRDRFSLSEPVVISLEVPDEVLVKRLQGRRVCPKCGDTYHMEHSPPRSDEKCDSCGSDLVHREDDKPEVVRERLSVYHEETAPVLEVFEHRGHLASINGDGAPDAIFSRIREVITEAY